MAKTVQARVSVCTPAELRVTDRLIYSFCDSWLSELKKLLKLALSRRAQLALRKTINGTKAGILSAGSFGRLPYLHAQVFPVSCDSEGESNEWCPHCRSLGRHRLICLYLEYRTLLLAGQSIG